MCCCATPRYFVFLVNETWQHGLRTGLNSSQRDICVEDFEGEGAHLGKTQLKASQFKMRKHRNVFTLWILLFFPTTGGAMKFNLFSKTVTATDPAHSLDHSISLSDDLGKMFDSGEGCDFLILIQRDTKEEDDTPVGVDVTVCTHHTILSQFPLFNASGETTSITVVVSRACQQHFIPFIRYIYTRKVDVTSSSAQCFHSFASMFGVKQLMEDTGHLFTKILPEDASFHSQVSLHEYAVKTGDSLLQENCIRYLAWNFQSLTSSPVWPKISDRLLRALLSRSDLVVPDEYSLLQTVERWIKERGNMTGSESQVELLSRIRFPMISAEKLYELENSSVLYNAHMSMYRDNMFRAFQFNVLLFSKLLPNPKFNKESDDYQPRIYTAAPWSAELDLSKASPVVPIRRHYSSYDRRYPYNRGYARFDPTFSPLSLPITESFNTPVHNSLIFKPQTVDWEANFFKKQEECSSKGVSCESLPVVRLSSPNQSSHSNVRFANQLLLMCQGKYICRVHDFDNNMAQLTVNGTQAVDYPCPEGQYTYRLVVRPQYA